MGKKKVAVFDLSESQEARNVATGTRGKKLTLKKQEKSTLTPTPIKAVKPKTETPAKKRKSAVQKVKTKKRVKHPRSKKYLAAREKINNSIQYPIEKALKLLRQVSFAKFDASVELHLNLKIDKLQGELQLPHGTGKKQLVEIASEKTLAKLNNQQIDFDVLIAEPKIMPQLAKYAKILGPKGLMPNPKTNTVTDKPEELKKKLEAGALQFKSEKKSPIIHLTIGRLSFQDKQLQQNIEAVFKTILPKNITQAFLCSSMSPSIKLQFGD